MPSFTLLGLDQGSSHTRAVLFTDRGEKRAASEASLRTFSPSPGVVEHDPKELLRSALTAIYSVLRQSKKKIAALGIANQRSTLLCWNGKTGEPYAPAISWQTRYDLPRSQTAEVYSKGFDPFIAAEQQFMKRWAYPGIQAKTGLPLTPYYSATKLNRLLGHVRRDHLRVGTVNTFLIWHLTKGKSYVTDPTNAQRMLLYNILHKAWDDDLLKHFCIPRNLLPEVLPNQAFFGEAVLNGQTIPITASIGDQQSSMIGLGGMDAGAANVNYGSGGFLLIHTGTTPHVLDGLLASIACSDKTQTTYLIEGTVNSVGTLFTWLQKIGMIQTMRGLDAACRRAQSPVLFLPALAGLGAPYWKSGVRGSLWGLTPSTSKEEIVRGAVEGIAYRIHDTYQLVPDAIKRQIHGIVATGGGARIPFLLQFQADLLNRPLQRSTDLESTVRGAAFLAGKSAELTDKTQFAFAPLRQEIAPQITPRERNARIQRWKQFIDRATASCD